MKPHKIIKNTKMRWVSQKKKYIFRLLVVVI